MHRLPITKKLIRAADRCLWTLELVRLSSQIGRQRWCVGELKAPLDPLQPVVQRIPANGLSGNSHLRLCDHSIRLSDAGFEASNARLHLRQISTDVLNISADRTKVSEYDVVRLIAHGKFMCCRQKPVNFVQVRRPLVRGYARPADGLATPIRRISHLSSTPLVSRTRRRTSSPSASMSAEVAEPRFTRKLVCMGET